MKARKSAHVARACLKINDQALTASQESLWRSAACDADSLLGAERARAATRLRQLELHLQRGRAEAEVRQGLADSLGLARARGEQVEDGVAADRSRRIRIASRDGLETLARTGGISPAQFKAGMLYRDLYEATDPERDLRSQMTNPAFLGAGPAKSAAPAETWAERRLRLSRVISGLETKVRVADRNDRAVRALREVAGHARCLSHFVKGGGGQAAYRSALVLALDVVAGHFGVG